MTPRSVVYAMAQSVCLVFSMAPGAWAQPVQVHQESGRLILDNGQLQIGVARDDGFLDFIRQWDGHGWHDLGVNEQHAAYEAHGDDFANDSRKAMYWDANADVRPAPAGVKPATKGYYRPAAGEPQVYMSHASDERAEVVVALAPTALFPFRSQLHYVLFADRPEFYAYAVLEHGPEQPAATLYQNRFVIKTVMDGTFSHWAVGGGQLLPIPQAAVAAQVSDATFRLADGSIKTKYMNSVFWAQNPVYGYVGAQRGLWMIEASPEYHNGGPSKQGQTLHDNVLLRVMQSVHFGASPVVLAQGEPWRKVYGPFLIYANHGNGPQALEADAQRQWQQEKARWPYAWVDDSAYSQHRGAVSGSVRLGSAPATDAWVILTDPGVAWTAQSKGYAFWTRLDAQGEFHLQGVVPGTYDLYVSGADQPRDLLKRAIRVKADSNVQLQPLAWATDPSWQTLWQIGHFDRSAAEFRNGDAPRQFELYRAYAEQFPHDVDYRIGSSQPAHDWNYAQWTVYNQHPDWRVHFALSRAFNGKAQLTLGFASSQPAQGQRLTDLRVSLNGQELAQIALPKSGTAGYRGSAQDSPYAVHTLNFDAALLKAGDNLLTLRHANGEPFKAFVARGGGAVPGQVMYDALRLQVRAPAKE
ncbi:MULTISPECIES: polysaccharide lyase family protein [unclassified Pseudomonas]|uniref:polysaccharide lyase family protein n=1 Tax=unclassified Pseudomonas TaxID=196821 RepID=UPI0025E92BFA|nr:MULTISPECIES: polysaccharide lyase family protein [unclassified Pseudomonas]